MNPHEAAEWRPVSGYEGLYEVSSEGQVRSIPRRYTAGGILRPGASEKGYLTVNLHDNGARESVCVHRLVLHAFVGPLPDGQVTRHLNGDRFDNRFVNLAYGTPAENNLDTVKHGGNSNSTKTHCSHGHEFTDENTYLKPNGGRDCRECLRRRRAEYRCRKTEPQRRPNRRSEVMS